MARHPERVSIENGVKIIRSGVRRRRTQTIVDLSTLNPDATAPAEQALDELVKEVVQGRNRKVAIWIRQKRDNRR